MRKSGEAGVLIDKPVHVSDDTVVFFPRDAEGGPSARRWEKNRAQALARLRSGRAVRSKTIDRYNIDVRDQLIDTKLCFRRWKYDRAAHLRRCLARKQTLTDTVRLRFLIKDDMLTIPTKHDADRPVAAIRDESHGEDRGGDRVENRAERLSCRWKKTKKWTNGQMGVMGSFQGLRATSRAQPPASRPALSWGKHGFRSNHMTRQQPVTPLSDRCAGKR